MEGLKLIPYIALVLAVSGVIIGASAVTLGSFADTTTDADALNVLANASLAESELAQQLPTVAVIGVMVIIISLIAGVFVYMRYFG